MPPQEGNIIRLTAAREQSGKTQAQVAKEIGVSESMYQRYEYGKVEPDERTAIRISRAVNSTVEALWGEPKRFQEHDTPVGAGT